VPITRCPSCNESLEVPAVVPGGLVACPYCGEEFAPTGATGGRGAPRRGRGGRGRDAGGRDAGGRDNYDDGYGARGGYRKKSDPIPIIVAIVAVLLLGGVGIYVMAKKKVRDEGQKQAFYAKVAATQPVSFPMPPTPPPPDSARAPFDLVTLYLEKDLVTLMELSYSSGIRYPENDPQVNASFKGLNYTVKTEKHGERVTAADGSSSTHVGHYLVPSYVWGTSTVLSNVTVDATFKLNRKGRLVPGTFSQTGGTTISPVPEFIADRGMGVLPNKKVLLYEVWGMERLDNPLARNILLDGRSLDSIQAQRQRAGGWRIATGTLETKEADGSWTHKAAIDLRLNAVENGMVRNFTYHGQPAELSFATKWTGEAEYMLKKQLLVRVGNLKTAIEVQVKTQTEVYRWIGQTMMNLKLYKDP